MVADAGMRLLGLFGLAGLGLVGVRHRPDFHVLATRFAVWAGIAVVWLAALSAGPAGVRLLAAVIGFGGAVEYGHLVALPRNDRAVLVVAGSLLPVVSVWGGLVWLAALAVAILLATAPPLLAQDITDGWDRLARTTLGVLWIGAAATAVAVLAAPDLLALGLAVALADIGGFVGGQALGGRPLAPHLSPNKTWGGIVGAACGGGLGVLVVADLVGIPVGLVPMVGVAVAIAATWGDLLESLVKRTVSVKDAGRWLPGFGGLLDRADSLFVAAPAWWVVRVLMGGGSP